MMSRLSLPIALFSSLLFGLLPLFAQSNPGGYTVVVDPLSEGTIDVAIRSGDSETQSILKTAFSIHGGYRLVSSPNDATFTIEVQPGGGSGASLSIYSGVPEQRQFSKAFVGSSRRNSILQAIDLAIRKTSGSPGFFSGKLAFIGEGTGVTEVYVSDFLFGEVFSVTSDAVDSVRPRWSGNGNAIVYTSYKSGYPDIYRLDLVNRKRSLLVSLDGTNLSARYSPDGARLAMVLTGKGNAEVYVGNEYAQQLQRLTATSGDEAAPCWSPRGDKLLVASTINGGLQLYVLPAFGGPFSNQELRRVHTQISGYCAEPDWNPRHENIIAFTARVRDGFQLALYDFNEGKSSWLTNESGDALEAQWLNDGRHLIYTARTANGSQIVLMDTITKRRSVISPRSIGKVSQASFWIQ